MMQEVNQDDPFPPMLLLYVSVSKNQNKKCLLAFIHCSSFTKLLVINERGSQFSFHQSFAKIMDEWLQVYHEGG
jgi:hypothetical protein